MPKTYPVENNFTGGKLSSLLHRRSNLKSYAHGLKQCRNLIVLPHGGVTLRGGTRYVDDTKAATGNVRLIPFVFSETPSQSYILEFGALYIRFYWGSDHSQIQSGGNPYELVTEYAASDIPNIRYAQSADVLYLVDGAHPPKKLTRSAHASWVLSDIEFSGNPFEPGNTVQWKAWDYWNDIYYSRLVQDGTWNEIFSEKNPYNLTVTPGQFPLDTTYGLSYDINGMGVSAPAFLEDYRTSYPRLAIEYSGTIYLPNEDYYYFALHGVPVLRFYFGPKNLQLFRIQDDGAPNSLADRDIFANNGTRTYHTEYAEGGATRTLLTVGEKAFKLRVAECTQGADTDVGRFVLAWRRGGDLDSSQAAGLPASLTLPYLGTVPNNTIKDWYGARCFQIRVWIVPNNTANFGWAYREETAVNTFTAWTAVLGNIDSNGNPQNNDGDPIAGDVLGTGYSLADVSSGGEFQGSGIMSTFKLSTAAGHTGGDYWTWKVGFIPIPASAFQNSETIQGDTSYPKTVTLFENRLFFGGSNLKPSTVRASKTGKYDNFSAPSGRTVRADDPLEFTIASNQVDPIRWIRGGRKLLIGTLSAEYVASGLDGPLTPDNIDVKPNSRYGSDFVDPVQPDNALLFVEKSGLRIRDYYYRFDVDGYAGDDDSLVSYEEIKNGVKEMAYQQAGLIAANTGVSIFIPPVNLVWVVTDQYELRAITYERQHRVIAWHDHTVGTGAEVYSVACIPGASGDEAWFIVKRGSLRSIEYLSQSATFDKANAENPVLTQYEIEGILEILPPEAEMGEGQTSRSFPKSWIDAYVGMMGAQGVKIARGSVDFDTYYQTLATVASGPDDKRVHLTGWDKESTLILKTGKHATTGAAYPATILTIYGRLLINAT